MKWSQRNRNPHTKPSKEVKKILMERMKLDLEFYDFVKQRLALQYKTIVEIKENIPYETEMTEFLKNVNIILD